MYRSERHFGLAQSFGDTQPAMWPACTADACHSGDLPCPCPQSCQVADPVRFDADGWAQLRWLGAGLGILFAALLALHFAIRWAEM